MSCCSIPLTQGQFAIVDAQDFEMLNKHKWYALWDPRTKSYRAIRESSRADGGRTIYMSREIMGNPPGMLIDHRNHETLDNRRKNLRSATVLQNNQNQRLRSDNTSGRKGVSWHKGRLKWQARISINGRETYLDIFADPDSASKAYDVASKIVAGQFAYQKAIDNAAVIG